MGRDQLEIAQAHWSASNYAPWQEPALWDGLCRCYEAGLCRAVGASNFGPKQLRKFAQYCKDRNVPLVLNQVQFSLLSTAPLESGLMDVCQELGITVVAYSPLALGALSGKYTLSEDGRQVVPARPGVRLPDGPRALLIRQVLPGAADLIRQLESIAQKRNKTVAQVALNWCVCKGAVPIVGARSSAQVRENLGALGWRLSNPEVQALDRAAALAKKKATQNVFMTN
jgi:pyridoxine 4-dehydrogenase